MNRIVDGLGVGSIWINVSNSVLTSNKDGERQQCWFATKTTSCVYYWTFGSSIWGVQRSEPAPMAPIDRTVRR